ncbi:hypothetical protein GJAV_G00178720 [Gymnothorax javanicus]|nr:hypothetical protein GJAV_G00178720 [Gymnothorax javanicus]
MCRTMADISKRILTALGNGPARRSLFGPVDRDQLKEDCQNIMQKDLEDASRRWSFNFATETPMEGGDYKWEGVVGANVPVLYRSSTVGAHRGRQRPSPSTSRLEPRPADKENIPHTPTRCKEPPQIPEKTPKKNHSQKLKRKQTNITDFYNAKRRVVATPRKSGQ